MWINKFATIFAFIGMIVTMLSNNGILFISCFLVFMVNIALIINYEEER